jgi:hypothetical protein
LIIQHYNYKDNNKLRVANKENCSCKNFQAKLANFQMLYMFNDMKIAVALDLDAVRFACAVKCAKAPRLLQKTRNRKCDA